METIKPDMGQFAAFILAHGRPELHDTFDKLRDGGYTGKIIFIIDNEDALANKYIEMYGSNNVYQFNKIWYSFHCDSMNNFGNRKAILFARNACFDAARDLGIKYFVQLDDDYYYFGHRGEYGAKKTNNLDAIFNYFVEFLLNTNVSSIAFSQGGDHIGGYDCDVLFKRKAMNSFFCLTDRPFQFYGTMNDDVNCYLVNGKLGKVFLTYMPFQLDQADSQQNEGGMTSMYKDMGTYSKSFFSIMCSPSCVKIKLMGCNFKRLHHSISYQNSVPMIINESYKKK